MSADFGKKLSGQTKAGGMFNPGTVEGLGMGQAAGDTGISQAPLASIESISDKGLDTLGSEQFEPIKFQSSLATEGASPLNFLTGDGAQGNLLDNLPSYAPEGKSIMDSMTEFTTEQSDYISSIIKNNPDMTQEELDELLASMGGQ